MALFVVFLLLGVVTKGLLVAVVVGLGIVSGC